MSPALSIKDVAEASGFTAATLRYYEQIGILPPAARTPAGYRTYDERTLDRLAFIARAKQLGCSLEEINGLTAAWDGGRCGPVRDQLSTLVAEKVAAAQDQLTELQTFTGDLRRAAAALGRHRPEGACDAHCGCMSDASDEPVPAEPGRLAIACTLSAGSMSDRIADWQNVLTYVEARTRIDGGVRCVFSAALPGAELMRLVVAEQECCQFFRFAITVDHGGLALEVRAPADALLFVEALFGEPS